MMATFKTFSEYVQQRDGELGGRGPSAPTNWNAASIPNGDLGDDAAAQPTCPDERDRVAERSMFRGLFKAVNPARPVSPTNSRLLASPSRTRLKSQIIGK